LEESWSLAAAAEAAGVNERTASKWVGRYRVESRAAGWFLGADVRPRPDR
jgi:hypothetical protein